MKQVSRDKGIPHKKGCLNILGGIKSDIKKLGAMETTNTTGWRESESLE